MKSEFRLFEQADLAGCLRLWSENSEWGEITSTQWQDWYIKAPGGPSIVSVMTDDRGEIVGQLFLTPTAVQVGKRCLRAVRLSAPIVRKDLRSGTLKQETHPVIGLFRIAASAAAEKGFSIVYALPALGWLPVFKWASRVGVANFDQSQFECVGRSLDVDEFGDLEGGEFECRVISNFGTAYQHLWEDVCSNLMHASPQQVQVTRSPDILQYRNGGNLNVEILHRGQLLGYLSLKPQSGLIVDYLARSLADLTNVLKLSIAYLAKNQSQFSIPGVIKSIDAPPAGSLFQQLGFSAIGFQFAFVCCPLTAEISRDEIFPQRWLLTAGD